MRTVLRPLLRRPTVTLLTILTLGLGIAATTVVFSLAYGVLVSPLPYANAGRVVLLWEYDRASERDLGASFGPMTTVPQADFAAWQHQTRTLERLDALTFGFFRITQGARPTEVLGGRVTRDFFHTLGVRPLLGRTFAATDPGDVAVLEYGLWQTQFGGDRSVVGRRVTMGDESYTVVGVLPPRFFFYLRQFALWTPLELKARDRRARPVMGVGLLRPGFSAAQAQAEFAGLARRLEREAPVTHRHRGAQVTGLRAQYSRFFRPIVVVLLAWVGFLLLIACANAAGLMLARAAEREREMAIRTALGATAGQIVRRLLAESVALALASGVAGMALALVFVPLVRALLPMRLPIPLPGIEDITVNAPVLLCAAMASLGTVLLFGLAPALRCARATLGTRAASPRAAHARLLDGIVVSELAISVLLLTGAGLTVRSVHELYRGMGFRSDHVLTFRTPAGSQTPPARLAGFYGAVLREVGRLPGVRAAAAAYALPGDGGGASSPILAEAGSPDIREAPRAQVNPVSGEFFRAMEIPLLAGRTFSGADAAGAREVAILSAGLARRLFAGADPLDRRIRTGGPAPGPWMTVVGIVGDVRPMLGRNPGPTVYRPFAQNPPGAIGFVIRTAGEPLAAAPEIERAVWRLSPGQPITYLETLASDLDDQGYRERLSAIGLGWFAGVGLVLAAVGLYGLMSYAVKQRLREFGVRLAVGAGARDIMRLVLRRGALLIAAGLLLGTGGSLLLTGILKSVLYGVRPIDPPIFAAAAAVLAAAGLAACVFPARRAAAVDPIEILRDE